MATVLLALNWAIVAATAALPETPGNLLRNGSFEGGMLYWHNLETNDYSLVRGSGVVGEHALCIKKSFAMSAPFVAKRGEPFTVSFFVKGDKPGMVEVAMPPSAREVGQKSKRLWAREGGQRAQFGTEWQRVSFTWPADVPQDGFWPNPHYLVQIGGGGTSLPIYIDGVTVTQGREGTPVYVPRREIEVLAECPDLPGYAGARANIFDRGAAPRVTAHVSNPGKETRALTVRWQLFDYEGKSAVGEAVEKRLAVPPGKTISETVMMKLTSVGMVLARVSVFDDLKSPIDSSDLPLTSLPYPKSATKPDWRERFGGSFAGGLGSVQKFQRLGFGWIRWRPHANGEDHLPKEPADVKDAASWTWKWFDQELDEQEAHGQSSHLVLYPPPKWIMEKDHPLPKDMRWPANDPRWDDLSVETVWDKFVKSAVTHYKTRSVIYEIENEPEFDHWDDAKEQYAKFTIRTARLIKQIDPKAKVMVDNVYGIPSGVNAAFFKAGGLKFIDVMSWHDYHEGWLTDAVSLKRMRQNLDEAGGKHVEIWFNEGWAFSNTAVDEPIACTHLTSAQSANAIFDCVAELTANGQDKTILFHTAYEQHGMSFWDYSGPGTMLWDWYNYPLPIAAAWNVLAHHIGVSETAGFVRPPGANFCIFQDQRNHRGVMIAYADRESKSDATLELPDFGTSLVAEDMMGNNVTAPKTLKLSQTGRPVILYAANGSITGKQFAEKLAPLDRRHASFVSNGSGSAPSWNLPPTWEGQAKGSSEGSVATAEGKPVWKLEQIWPPDPKKPSNYRPMVWTGTDWNVKEGGFGGQPGARLDGRALNLATRAPHGNPPQWRVAALTFVAPQSGTYSLGGTAECRIWDGKNKTTLRLFHKKASGAAEVGNVVIPHGGKTPLDSLQITVAAGEEFALVPQIEGGFAGGDCKLRDLCVRLGGKAATASGSGLVFKLPAAWDGVKKGSTDGNPILTGGRPVWRLDQLWPDNPIMADAYIPLAWSGTEWKATEHEQGGQPAARVENGSLRASVRGPWTGNAGQKTCALLFVAPQAGIYVATGTAKSMPWEGGAKTFKLGVFKKDTQRAAPLQTIELPRDGSPVPFKVRVELTAGHELVFLPLMPDWHNATAISIDGLTIEQTP
jgi:hypothetical protein